MMCLPYVDWQAAVCVGFGKLPTVAAFHDLKRMFL
jgi:hypothetical protein